MKTLILIPARYASTRYPGKPLAALRQPNGTTKSLIQMTWEAARTVAGIDDIRIATDDDRIRTNAEGFGAHVIMTSESCENGTARCADALARMEVTPDLVINLQGDAPLTPPWFIEALIETMKADSGIMVATPVLRCDTLTYGHFVEDRHHGRVGGTTVVLDCKGDALYFSKEVIPYIPEKERKNNGPNQVFHHVGVYAYRPKALVAYSGWKAERLETLEGLEQLRFLENGMKVRCVEVDGRGRVFWELNNPNDVARIETALGTI